MSKTDTANLDAVKIDAVKIDRSGYAQRFGPPQAIGFVWPTRPLESSRKRLTTYGDQIKFGGGK